MIFHMKKVQTIITWVDIQFNYLSELLRKRQCCLYMNILYMNHYKNALSSNSRWERRVSDNIYKAKYLMLTFHRQVWLLYSLLDWHNKKATEINFQSLKINCVMCTRKELNTYCFKNGPPNKTSHKTSIQKSGCHKDGKNIIWLKTGLLKLWYFSFCPSLNSFSVIFRKEDHFLRLTSFGQDLIRTNFFVRPNQ